MSITLGLTKLIIIEFIQNISLFLTGLISPANSVRPANIDQIRNTFAGFSLRILVAGERCNVTGEHFERGSTSEKKKLMVIGYGKLKRDFCVVKGEFSDFRCLMNTLHCNFATGDNDINSTVYTSVQ